MVVNCIIQQENYIPKIYIKKTIMTTEGIEDLIYKKVSIRSRDYPHFELINGILNQGFGDFDYNIEYGEKRFSFNISVIKDRINDTLFV